MRRGVIVLFAAMVALLLATGTAAAVCTKPHHHAIGSGPIPSGETWVVSAGVKNNGSCEGWLFSLEFSLGEFGNAGTGTGIPAGGHVPREYFALSANDIPNVDSSERVFYGYTGSEGAKVVATMKSGESFNLRPRLAPAPLRRRIAWLRSFRYFVYFHPNDSPIEQVSVFTRGGRLIYRTKSFEGSFF
jgi:hypothetical protein